MTDAEKFREILDRLHEVMACGGYIRSEVQIRVRFFHFGSINLTAVGLILPLGKGRKLEIEDQDDKLLVSISAGERELKAWFHKDDPGKPARFLKLAPRELGIRRDLLTHVHKAVHELTPVRTVVGRLVQMVDRETRSKIVRECFPIMGDSVEEVLAKDREIADEVLGG